MTHRSIESMTPGELRDLCHSQRETIESLVQHVKELQGKQYPTLQEWDKRLEGRVQVFNMREIE